MRGGLSKLTRDAELPRNEKQQEAFTTRKPQGTRRETLPRTNWSKSYSENTLTIVHSYCQKPSKQRSKRNKYPKGSLSFLPSSVTTEKGTEGICGNNMLWTENMFFRFRC